MNKVALIAVAAAALFGSNIAQAASVPFVVESDGRRPGAVIDIPTGANIDLGFIDSATSQGLAGRIVEKIDSWTFSTDVAFSVTLANLMVGDGNQGFDARDTFLTTNGVQDATFSLFEISGSDVLVEQETITSVVGGGLFDRLLFNSGPGQYRLDIDGLGRLGSTYDLVIATVPVPAALPLFLSGLGALFAVTRRKSA